MFLFNLADLCTLNYGSFFPHKISKRLSIDYCTNLNSQHCKINTQFSYIKHDKLPILINQNFGPMTHKVTFQLFLFSAIFGFRTAPSRHSTAQYTFSNYLSDTYKHVEQTTRPEEALKEKRRVYSTYQKRKSRLGKCEPVLCPIFLLPCGP